MIDSEKILKICDRYMKELFERNLVKSLEETVNEQFKKKYYLDSNEPCGFRVEYDYYFQLPKPIEYITLNLKSVDEYRSDEIVGTVATT